VNRRHFELQLSHAASEDFPEPSNPSMPMSIGLRPGNSSASRSLPRSLRYEGGASSIGPSASRSGVIAHTMATMAACASEKQIIFLPNFLGFYSLRPCPIEANFATRTRGRAAR
jgi:hypothetical protein